MRKYKTISEVLKADPPASIKDALENWPRHDTYEASPGDWRREILYFLLPDRFANEDIKPENLLNRRDGTSALKSVKGAHCGNWKNWCESGSSRFQGGTIKGIIHQLDYLKGLGITTLWVGPVFRQRCADNTYHGYGIQDFFDIDPRFGTRDDLIALVKEAHKKKMRIVLDIIFNHSGTNWLYDPAETGGNVWEPPFIKDGYYNTLLPRSGMGHALAKGAKAKHRDDFVWPTDLRPDNNYWKKGSANLSENDYTNPLAEHKVGDFCSLRAFNTTIDGTLSSLITIYQYWIALTDCDGFRIDTVKHVSAEAARNWCNAITEYGETLEKNNFLLLGEIAGGSGIQSYYTNEAINLDASLDIGNIRLKLRSLGQGFLSPSEFFNMYKNGWDDGMGSHRRWGYKHVSVCDDHDHVMGEKLRFSVNAPSEVQVIVPVAIQFFCLGIPCIYYGTEQALRGLPREDAERNYITSIKNDDGKNKYNIFSSDWLLREAMFGPDHPLKSGYSGTQGEVDTTLPGFGVEGTRGKHVFDTKHPAYLAIAALAKIRSQYIEATHGRQYMCDISVFHDVFAPPGPGELLAWTRVHDLGELLIIINTHGTSDRGGWVAVNPDLTSTQYYVLADTYKLGDPEIANGKKTIKVKNNGNVYYIDPGLLKPNQVIVLANYFIA